MLTLILPNSNPKPQTQVSGGIDKCREGAVSTRGLHPINAACCYNSDGLSQPHFFIFIHYQHLPSESPSWALPFTSRVAIVCVSYLTLLFASPASIVARQPDIYLSEFTIYMSDLDFLYKYEYKQKTHIAFKSYVM